MLLSAPWALLSGPQALLGAPGAPLSVPGAPPAAAAAQRTGIADFTKTYENAAFLLDEELITSDDRRRTGEIPRVPSESRRRSPFGRLCPLTSTCLWFHLPKFCQ